MGILCLDMKELLAAFRLRAVFTKKSQHGCCNRPVHLEFCTVYAAFVFLKSTLPCRERLMNDGYKGS